MFIVSKLNLQIKPKKRLVREKSESLSVPDTINQYCHMDFMHEQLANDRSFQLVNGGDDFN
ncbi:ISxcC1 transposase [Legionella santicrucis]|uniref:ISxcC1 transposase n=1 Tax=Legionella santicrucis TaxID=45074 RepID=A0A0W0YIE7_9GAMM|nr:ISxcC1 transposase [Legionella santicrucis]